MDLMAALTDAYASHYGNIKFAWIIYVKVYFCSILYIRKIIDYILPTFLPMI